MPVLLIRQNANLMEGKFSGLLMRKRRESRSALFIQFSQLVYSVFVKIANFRILHLFAFLWIGKEVWAETWTEKTDFI